MRRQLILITIFVAFSVNGFAQGVQLALLKYNGGGDWYADPTALPNLIQFCNKNLEMDLKADYAVVEASGNDIFNYPLVHITGHGNIVFSEPETENLRSYLLSGGFLYIDDNYGMDKYIRREMKKVFPDKEFVELPFDHPVYHQKYEFEQGLPKIHEHDKKPPQGFALIHEGRVICFYTYETDITDGWEDASVHNNPPEKRLEALRMGANIVQYVFMNR
ncbi:MAG TPA: DUF4159 domain-containing protein [Bacteroidales bacterium]|nr:DUF4159 domain-containing protein [Bacteroidales bacterium]